MIDIRPLTSADIDGALAANEASLPAVNSLTPDELRALAAQSRHTLVAAGPDGVVGLMVCLDETADYDSRNYAWLKENLGRFSYVDRIALAPAARGSGTGERLYRRSRQGGPAVGLRGQYAAGQSGLLALPPAARLRGNRRQRPR